MEKMFYVGLSKVKAYEAAVAPQHLRVWAVTPVSACVRWYPSNSNADHVISLNAVKVGVCPPTVFQAKIVYGQREKNPYESRKCAIPLLGSTRLSSEANSANALYELLRFACRLESVDDIRRLSARCNAPSYVVLRFIDIRYETKLHALAILH
ncbi:hypothetical protein DICVIV_04822 [Dictyocaulus viviparus]|uniref:Uncharacterized protein n=1 Tax=Dictyocaulus viviparus TaxID=29172 RepID=A0A0D8XWK8_DICVI|nr:hypothetical protein DICVIV_04822 [Dictyocaulus viviparus]